jgi:hypothetical protein
MYMSDPPKLIEPGVKYFLNGTLKECRKFKDNHYNSFFNIYMLFILVAIIGGFLIYRYKGKLTPLEISIKNRKKQEYIMSKLQQLAHLRKYQDNNLITTLPHW